MSALREVTTGRIPRSARVFRALWRNRQPWHAADDDGLPNEPAGAPRQGESRRQIRFTADKLGERLYRNSAGDAQVI